MKDWRQGHMRPMIDRVKGCRHCMTSRGIKKMKDVISRVRNHFTDLWTGRNKK
ncbi:MAG: hypothetical protein WC747_01245 [Candidatus Babeliales bacterium]|jgi:tryptophan 2,3-dioxygenase